MEQSAFSAPEQPHSLPPKTSAHPGNQTSASTFTYDGSGNPTQYNGSGTSAYAYDPEQRLTGLGGFSAHYDGDGLRDYTIASGTTTYFVYDGPSPVLEETYSGSTATIQVANGMADGWRERYAATSFGFNAYGFDPQGSLNVEDSSFDTTLPAQNVYVFDGYGNRLVGERVSNGSTTAFNIDPVQFGGQYGYYTDTSTGEVQLTHRYYDAATGHFLNRDPIGYSGGQNLYAFCGNNPIMGSDPDGTSKDPMPTDDPDWVRFSIALFIPMKEFRFVHTQGFSVIHKGDGRSYNYNTDADRVRVDFALNTKTGALMQYPAHTNGSQMTLYNGFVERATASLTKSVHATAFPGGWKVSVSGKGWDPFYDAGSVHLSPPALFTATMFIRGTSAHGSVKYAYFPSIEIYEYNSTLTGGHQFLFGYQPSTLIRHSVGPGMLAFGTRNTGHF